MDEEQDGGFELNPEPEELRDSQKEDVARAAGSADGTKDADDHRKMLEIPEPDIDEKKAPDEVGPANDIELPRAGNASGGGGVDAKSIHESRVRREQERRGRRMKAGTEEIPEPEFNEPLKLPNGGGVNPRAIREKRSGIQNAKTPESIEEPDFDKLYLDGDKANSEAWEAIRKDRAAKSSPPGDRSPDNEAESLTPQGNDKDLNDQIIESRRRYLEQERKYKQTELHMWDMALAALVSDHKRLEQLEAAFERGREGY